MVRIAHITPGSIAEALELEIGSRVVTINGAPVRDGIDLRFLEADGLLEVEVAAPSGGASTVFEIEKDAAETLGVVPAPDAVRQCANRCVFCFIDGNPPAARERLFLKDDDFRLSFTYGSYVTLTNLGRRGFRRLIEQRLSPLYVSVHATEPAVRERILGVPRGGDVVDRLRDLVDAGLDVHTQVVLCPGWNDGAHLDRTIEELWDLGPGVASLSVVPVGLTRYNLGRPVRLLRPAEAESAIAQVDAARSRALRERGAGWAYAADELFLIARRAVPAERYYDDWPLTENGVGAVRAFLDDLDAALRDPPRLEGRRITMLTGTRMAEVLAPWEPRVASRTGARFRVLGVPNTMYGETVTTAGLLPGRALLDALERADSPDHLLVPAEALNDDDVFVDDVPLVALEAALPRADVRPGHRLGALLATL
ncbi:MAG: DUF512 domain-containing protein [Longimicrobiales bacterium]